MDELTRLTAKLITFKTVKEHPEELQRCTEFIARYFKNKHVRKFMHNGKPSLFITNRKTKRPKILLNGHIDVVEGEPEQFLPRIKAGRLYGRGAVDMKAGVAACMLAMQHSTGDVGLMIVADEEIGGMDGTGFLIKKGYGGRFVIGAEPNQAKQPGQLDITIAHKGVLWIKVIAHGKACHGSRPWLGKNAAEKLIAAYAAIKKAFPETTPQDRWKNTLNLGSIHAGNSPNRVPDRAEMTLDIRFTENNTPQKLLSRLRKLTDCKIETIEASPLLKNKNNRMIKKLQKTIMATTKKPCLLLKEHGSSDLRYTSEKGMTSVIFGPRGANYHGKDEYVEVRSLATYYAALMRFLNEES
ncbi:MAG: M20/M25/M40 family metallo-hydrolase [archaeon]